MSIQTIFVPLQKEDLLLPKLGYALALAGGLDSSIEVGFIHEGHDPATIDVNFTGGDVAKGFALNAEYRDQIDVDALRRDLSTWPETYRPPAGGRHPRIEMHEYWKGIDNVLARVGRLRDLILTGPCRSRSNIFADSMSRASLLMSARLILGLGDVQVEPARMLERVVIAWDGGASATRTVVQALPILRLAVNVSVVVIGNPSSSGPSTDDLVDYLSARQVTAQAVSHPKDLHTTGSALLKYLDLEKATLLLMGAYSHNRTGELIFGGTTVDVLERIRMPVLTSF
ncbi:universal stress protein (plasmid) [Lichenicola cladoniae]|uniref:Universal stress protein n=1 Tax=Lichenicola cladoniae TaxID=1484109 RepID=A0A6M8HYT0_9PROT|nr:universal stress protein [Lichenicola cladoniae]NPD66806.1 universal stress protein [Acetobacteraceae bacterium]QKE93498.1 universal stress protein [Lichenicola cladoniae]